MDKVLAELCRELADDLEFWISGNEFPSLLNEEYEKSMILIKRVREALQNTQ